MLSRSVNFNRIMAGYGIIVHSLVVFLRDQFLSRNVVFTKTHTGISGIVDAVFTHKSEIVHS